MKEKISVATNIVLIVCAIVVTAILIKNEFFSSNINTSNGNSPTIPIKEITGWEDFIQHSFIEGTPEAKATLIKYYDYECPFCTKLEDELKLLSKDIKNDVRIIYKHLPLDYHDNALSSAIAVECARKDNSFLPLHHLLFENNSSLSDSLIKDLALGLGIEENSFISCFENKETKDLIQNDIELAEKLGINSIPTIIINGSVYEGALTSSQLEVIISDL